MKKLVINAYSNQNFWVMPKQFKDNITKRYGNHFDISIITEQAGLRKKLQEADIIVGYPFSKVAVKKNHNLSNIHFWTAGIPSSWQEEDKIKITTSSGVNASSVCEHAMYFTYSALRGLLKQDRLAENPKNHIAGIMGVGEIGSRISTSISPLFKEVRTLSRSKKGENWFSPSELEKFLNDVSYLYLALPSTIESKKLFTVDVFFKNLHSKITILNVARGDLFVEGDLVDFLSKNKYSRYFTDVVHPEPYPADGQLNQLKNVLITPHEAGKRDDIWQLIENKTYEILDSLK